METEGELICNEYIAQDLVEIFCELYRNEYQLEKVLLVDEYDGDADAAREDNNSFCFYYAPSETDSSLSRHALGLALDKVMRALSWELPFREAPVRADTGAAVALGAGEGIII